MDHCPDGSIRLRQPYLVQSIINMIPVMYESNNNPALAFNPSPAKNEGFQLRKNDFKYRLVIILLDF